MQGVASSNLVAPTNTLNRLVRHSASSCVEIALLGYRRGYHFANQLNSISTIFPDGKITAERLNCRYGATPAMELRGDQLGELSRDVCHRLFCSAQTASRAEEGADFAQSFIRRAVHDWNKQVTR